MCYTYDTRVLHRCWHALCHPWSQGLRGQARTEVGGQSSKKPKASSSRGRGADVGGLGGHDDSNSDSDDDVRVRIKREPNPVLGRGGSDVGARARHVSCTCKVFRRPCDLCICRVELLVLFSVDFRISQLIFLGTTTPIPDLRQEIRARERAEINAAKSARQAAKSSRRSPARSSSAGDANGAGGTGEGLGDDSSESAYSEVRTCSVITPLPYNRVLEIAIVMGALLPWNWERWPRPLASGTKLFWSG